jgi:hypothetical protein
MNKINNLRNKLIKNDLPNNFGKNSTIEEISQIIQEITSLIFKPIGSVKSLHYVSNTNKKDNPDNLDNELKFGWNMYDNLDGDIIIYEEIISFDVPNKLANSNYLDANIEIEEPRFWFWRIIHNRYNNTYTLKRIELGVECTNVKVNVPFRMCLKVIYDKIVRYESYRLK